MKLSQLTALMDGSDRIMIKEAPDLPITSKYVYKGEVQGIGEDNPINSARVLFIMAVDNDILVEILTEGKSKPGTLERAIQTYGKDMQLNVAVEELSELIKEICKNKRGSENIGNITEEMADCYIMLRQLEIIFQISDRDINTKITEKIERLKNRMDIYKISERPADDFAEVVRCERCENCVYDESSASYRCDRRGFYEDVQPDDYCSRGVRCVK